MEFRKLPIPKDPIDKVEALPEFIRHHPAYSASKGGAFAYAAVLDSYIKADHPEPDIFQQKLKLVQDALRDTVPAYYQTAFNSGIARILFRQNWDIVKAESLAESSAAMDDRSDCLQDDRFAAASHAIYTEKKEKHPVPFTYHDDDGQTHCGQELASRYALLGKIQVNLGMTDAGALSFQKALQAHPDVDAALGLATIDRAKGDKSAALDLLMQGQLTGGLSAKDLLDTKALYIELHPNSTPENYDALLDQRYAKTFVNPVKDLPTHPQPSRPEQVVLEEFFTGADCEPCIAPDLATEATLHRYNRDQVVLAVYHDNAPGPDPLTTSTSEMRAKYYGTGGSTPHVILDGKELTIEEGPRSHGQDAFEMMTRAIDPLLAARSEATLRVAAHPNADLLEVKVTGHMGDLPPKTHLEILLLETAVSYSGRNTLRFHPMVVRARAELAGGGEASLIAPHSELSQTYIFDMKKIEAENLEYYDRFREQLQHRMSQFISNGQLSKADVDKMAQFREPRNLIHRDRLAVAAFLQAEDSKQVLQTAFGSVERSSGKEKR
jgi:hypothetical protein